MGVTVSQLVLPFCTLATAVKLIWVLADTASVCARGVAPFTELNDKKVGTNVSGPLVAPPPFIASTTGTTNGLFETPACVMVTEPEYTPALLPAGSTETDIELAVGITVIHASLAVAVIDSVDASLAPKNTNCAAGTGPPT